MLEGSNQIEVWSNIVRQISVFFNKALSFSTYMAKAILMDLSFRKCHWAAKDMDTFFYSIEVPIQALKLASNCYKEFLNLINWKWSINAEEYIRSKGLVERTLKLIVGIAKRLDIFDLKTSLLLANTQAFRPIIEEKTFHLRRLFLTLQNW